MSNANSNANANGLSGTDKSAILLMTIGEDRAAEVFKHLSPREVQHLSAAMASVRQISNKQLTDVLAEFEQEAEQFAALSINTNDYLRSVLVKALGEERASSLLEDILDSKETTSGMETLNFMEPQSAADLIRDEHPQIIATILVHLKRARAADIGAVRRASASRRDAAYRHFRRRPAGGAGGADRSAEQPARRPEPQAQQNGRRENSGGNYQPDENAAGRSRYYGSARIRRRSGAENHRRNVPVRKHGGSRRPLHPAPAAGSGVRISAYRPQRCRAAAARNSCATCRSVRPISCATTANRGPVRLSQVENEQKAILLIVRRLAETGEMVIGSGEDTYV